MHSPSLTFSVYSESSWSAFKRCFWSVRRIEQKFERYKLLILPDPPQLVVASCLSNFADHKGARKHEEPQAWVKSANIPKLSTAYKGRLTLAMLISFCWMIVSKKNWMLSYTRTGPCPTDAQLLATCLRSGTMKRASRLFRAVGFLCFFNQFFYYYNCKSLSFLINYFLTIDCKLIKQSVIMNERVAIWERAFIDILI